jgi:hypothetical protein
MRRVVRTKFDIYVFIEINNGGDKTATNIHSVFVYPLFLQCCTGNEVCKGPISFSLWRLQMQCSDDVSMCRAMSSI